MSAKVLVFGVDAMEPRLILDWIESGDLPHLARLRARAAWGHVLNPPRFFSGASWPNFYTGVSPARHGRYLRTLYDVHTCVHRPFRPDFDETAPFWSAPEWRSKRTAILSVPFCPVDAGLAGLQMADSGLDVLGQQLVRAIPPAIATDIVARFGPDPVGDFEAVAGTTPALIDLRQRLLRGVGRKRDIARHYLASEEWDLFISGYDECHAAGHRFWHLHDPAHPHYAPNAAASLGGTLKEVYVEIDRAVGSVLGLLSPDSTAIFLSSHGMGPAFDGTAALDEILRRLDGFKPRALTYEEHRGQQLATLRAVMDRTPRAIQRILGPLRQRFGRGSRGTRLTAERRKRRYFWFPTHDLHGGIRINLVGREASGVVQLGREYEAVVAELTGDLHRLRDGQSGEPIVAEVVRSADIDLQGYAGDIPDLIVHWSKASLWSIESPQIGRIDPVLVRGRTGDHDPAMLGIFFAAGPRAIPGPIPEAVRLEDFAPTISTLLGIHLADTEGRTIPAVCARTVDALPPISTERPSSAQPRRATADR